MNQSTNYNFNLPEGTDLVNLLTQLIPNWSDLDRILKGVENQAFTNCTEVTSLGVHAISRTNSEGKILKWIATSNFTAGETFTVDGNVVAAATPSGATLATGAYVTGAVIIAALNSDESAMTVFVSGTNVATDSERLGGELPSYYAKDSDMDIAEQAITDLDNLMGTTSISAIGDGTVTGAISSLNSDVSDIINPTSVSVTADGIKSYSALFNSLFALIDTSKIKKTSQLVIEEATGTTCFNVSYYNSSEIRVSSTSTNTSDGKIYISGITLKTSGSMWKIGILTEPSSLSVANQSAAIAPSGRTYRFIY